MRLHVTALGLLLVALIFGPYTYSHAQQEDHYSRQMRESKEGELDSEYFWTRLDTPLVSNEFEVLSRVPFNYAGLKRSQEGFLLITLLVGPNGKPVDYGVSQKPYGVDVSPFLAVLQRIRFFTPEGRVPFTPEFQQSLRGPFTYLLYWPLFSHLPYGPPSADTAFNKLLSKLVRPVNFTEDNFLLTHDLEQGVTPIKFNAWVGSIQFPDFAAKRGVSGQIRVDVGVDTAGRVIRHRVVTKVHPVLLNAVMQRLYKLKYTPAMQRGRPVPAVHSFVLNARSG